MTRRITLGALLALPVLIAGPAAAQPPGGKTKWEYATLTFDEPLGDGQASATWEAGKQMLGGQSKTYYAEALAKIYKDLGGKEEHPTLAILLDHIGQGGWEMVSHTRVLDRGRSSRTWVFKRPVQ